MEIRAPTRGNRRLEALLAAANADERLHAWWHMQQVNADRLGMSDHSWVHIRIVLNIALRLFRLLNARGRRARDGHRPRDEPRDAEVVIAAACLFHDTGHVDPPHRPRGVSACSWPPTGCRCCSRASTPSPSARS